MTCDVFALANTGVQGLHPYQPGKPTSELERELGIRSIVKLASNENPLGISATVRKALKLATDELARYPDANGFYLKQALADKLSVSEDQITLGNGSNDVLELLARTFVSAEHEVVFSEYAFIVYPMVTQAIGAKAVQVPAQAWGHDLDAMAEAINQHTRMVFIANPNNPTGTFLSSDELLSFLRKVPEHVIVVLDEAYYEYVDERVRAPSVEWLSEFENLVICRTFSKAYGLAGLRVGYALSSPAIADLLNRVRQPFNVNSLALSAARTALNDTEYLAASVAVNDSGLQYLLAEFDDLGIEYIPTRGNFVCIDMKQPAAPIYDALLKQGVIVRPIAGYGMPNHLRVSVGLDDENRQFIQALRQILSVD